MIKRFLASTAALALALLLGSCGSFSGAVADHWPHWAGGEPSDVPPRPGQPGYAAFISHNGEARNDPNAPAAATQLNAPPAVTAPNPPSPGQANQPAAANQPNAAAPPATAAAAMHPPGDQNVVQQGGLY